MMSGVESFKHGCDQEDKEEERLEKELAITLQLSL